MRAIVCRALGDIDSLVIEDIAGLPLRDGCVRIAIAAAGINFADTLIIAGKYQIRPTPPFSPGFEVVGTVLEVAGDVSRCRPGDRVMAVIEYGGFHEPPGQGGACPVQMRKTRIEMFIGKAAGPAEAIGFCSGQRCAVRGRVPVVELVDGDRFTGAEQQGIGLRLQKRIAEALQAVGPEAAAGQNAGHGPGRAPFVFQRLLQIQKAAAFGDRG